jgi:hypothetical protein
MKPTTKKQREAMKRVYDRCPIFAGDLTAPELAMKAGWRFIDVADLPPELKAKVTNPNMRVVWMHGKVTPLYAEAADIVEHYGLAERLTYRKFRRTVQQGFDCLMVRWQGMWLGIETDGYVHS